jgi:hypothetical protein
MPEECIIMVAASLEKGNLDNRLGPPQQSFWQPGALKTRQFEQGVWYFAVRKRTWDRFAPMPSTY